MSLGRVDPGNRGEPFCMTVLGLKASRRANAVSDLHGYVSRCMWSCLWPSRPVADVPIGHITNGVHVDSRLAQQMQELYDRFFPTYWEASMGEPEVWQKIHEVDPGELWETHNTLKNTMITFVRRRTVQQCLERQDSQELIDIARRVLDPNALTIGFARRFATYKRADLILANLGRLATLLNDSARPIQLGVRRQGPSGRRAWETADSAGRGPERDPRFAGRIAFVENYDIRVMRAPRSGSGCVVEHPATADGSVRHQRTESGPQWSTQPVDPGRLVGRGL